MKFAVTNRFNYTVQAFTSIPRIGAGITLARRVVLIVLAIGAWHCVFEGPLKSQPATTSIHVSEILHDYTNNTVTIRWNGGFPPYHVRFASDLHGNWSTYARPVATNELTMASPSDGSAFFQVCTEFEPLELTAINYAADGAFVLLKWKGGSPPFQVQIFNPTLGGWDRLPGLLNQRHYEGFSYESNCLFRIASVADVTPPQSPSELFLYGSRCDRVVIGWRESNDGDFGSGISSYVVYRNDVQIRQLAPGANLFLDENLVPNSTNNYKIAAIDLMGNESSPSQPLSVVTPDCSDGGTNVTYENSRLTLTWDKSEEPSVGGYLVYWGNKPGLYPWQIDAMQTNTVTISDLIPGEAYFVSVTAYTIDGVESEPAPELIFIPPSQIESSYAAKAVLAPAKQMAAELLAK